MVFVKSCFAIGTVVSTNAPFSDLVDDMVEGLNTEVLVLDPFNGVDHLEFSIIGVERLGRKESVFRFGGGGVEDGYFGVLSILDNLKDHSIGHYDALCLLDEIPSENYRVTGSTHNSECHGKREFSDLN